MAAAVAVQSATFTDGSTSVTVEWSAGESSGFIANGRAVFSDDFGCELDEHNEFVHPYRGVRYKFYPPCSWSPDAVLDRVCWREVGRVRTR